jgi:translation elongation factor EF-1alpha
MFGKVESGTVRLGDQLSLFPSNTLCSVATVYNSKGEPVKYAKCGENIQLRLLNIEDENKINKGDVLCKLNDSIPITDLFEAEVEILELLSYKPILSKGY